MRVEKYDTMKWKTQRAYYVNRWGQPLKVVPFLWWYDTRPTADVVCTIAKSPTQEKRKYSLHIPLAESRKVGSERRAVGAVFPSGRAAFRNPKNLIHCLLGFWGPDWAFGCGIPAQKRHFHTRLSCLKVPFSAKSADFAPTFLSDAVNSVTFLAVTVAVLVMVKNLDYLYISVWKCIKNRLFFTWNVNNAPL